VQNVQAHTGTNQENCERSRRNKMKPEHKNHFELFKKITGKTVVGVPNQNATPFVLTGYFPSKNSERYFK
jgi:hypothetical protein